VFSEWIVPEYRETSVIKFNLNLLHDDSFQKLYLNKEMKNGKNFLVWELTQAKLGE